MKDGQAVVREENNNATEQRHAIGRQGLDRERLYLCQGSCQGSGQASPVQPATVHPTADRYDTAMERWHDLPSGTGHEQRAFPRLWRLFDGISATAVAVQRRIARLRPPCAGKFRDSSIRSAEP